MNIAIVGSRDFHNFSFLKTHVLSIIKNNNISITKIISGGAKGIDTLAEKFASTFHIPTEIIHADWSKGKFAGVTRNTDIVDKSDVVIAFWNGVSKGTLDSINKAKKKNKKLFIVKIDAHSLGEGVRLGGSGDYIFDFAKDEKDDILKLKYNSDYISKKNNRWDA